MDPKSEASSCSTETGSEWVRRLDEEYVRARREAYLEGDLSNANVLGKLGPEARRFFEKRKAECLEGPVGPDSFSRILSIAQASPASMFDSGAAMVVGNELAAEIHRFYEFTVDTSDCHSEIDAAAHLSAAAEIKGLLEQTASASPAVKAAMGILWDAELGEHEAEVRRTAARRERMVPFCKLQLSCINRQRRRLAAVYRQVPPRLGVSGRCAVRCPHCPAPARAPRRLAPALDAG
jgi:hypothetical protein